jgi:hypothetical protein
MLFIGHAQGQATPQAIVEEGKKLYRLEMASWYGTDIFLAKLGNRRQYSGGYFSYRDKDRTKCLFFSKGAVPKTLAVISFDSTYAAETAQLDSTSRSLTKDESTLYAIQQRSLEALNTDTLFRKFNNSNLNIIPLADKQERRAYVLTGPSVSDIVLFGNDYLLTFNTENKLIQSRRLHHNLIPTDYSKHQGPDVIGMHAHLPSTGDYITATDICTLMLYEKFAGWSQYYVISNKYVSIWNCKKDELFVMTKKAWDRISEDQKKRHSAAEKQ